MSRNHTEYHIYAPLDWKPKTARTLRKARGVLAFFGGGVVNKFRFTPSKVTWLRCLPKGHKQQPLTLRRSV